VWPALLAGIASAVVWTRGGPASVDLTDPLGVRGAGPRALGRVVVGVTLLIASIVVLVGTASNPFDVLAPAVGVLVGLVMLAAPLLQRVWVQVGDAREERARAQARDEVAAHLHDSVLQTLALIQRAGQDPAQVTALARRQERELRAWLYGGRASTDAPASLVAAVEQVAAEVEEDFPLAIEVVVVGDAPLADETRALLAAVREALTNVGKHAGVDRASCFVEVADGEVVAFVRDRGIGFDPASVPPDRRGIADSLRGRLERIGGHVTIESTEEDGTEVELAVPLPRAARSTG
jgi:signal transduction histidine kinase